MKIRLLITEAEFTPFVRHVRDWADTSVFDLVIPAEAGDAALIAIAGDCDALINYQAPVSAALIQAASKLRFIQKHGLNTRHINTAAAKARGIPIATTPLMRNITVAEHALALLLACSRKLIDGHHAVTQAVYQAMGLAPQRTTQSSYRPNWPRIDGLNELYGATIGIAGMGDIGMEIAKRCRAFGMHIAYHQRTRLAATVEHELGLHYASFDELLAQADYLMLALPHTPQTEGIINAQTLAHMKSSATLINMGRGALVDEAALAHALRTGMIRMAALDVYQFEPLPVDSALLTLPNIVFTPHLGGGSYRSWEVDMPASLNSIQAFFTNRSS